MIPLALRSYLGWAEGWEEEVTEGTTAALLLQAGVRRSVKHLEPQTTMAIFLIRLLGRLVGWRLTRVGPMGSRAQCPKGEVGLRGPLGRRVCLLAPAVLLAVGLLAGPRDPLEVSMIFMVCKGKAATTGTSPG